MEGKKAEIRNERRVAYTSGSNMEGGKAAGIGSINCLASRGVH
jgi:hypothetical protein